ncbi:hypothetical protein [Rufibacter hautae]|uniref:Uncharacterized protein n=1 Tax=Rufibacter hautae TaxID=2595005 RepID=A0A5B6TN21_9BACT|nr:hypothetical protein [Rufibacter hautae]KAA3437713.1 hypothetical protein FOA19_10440 [Rufibacter hautae]
MEPINNSLTHSNGENELTNIKFGPRGKVKFDKTLFLAEYNSLRQEILQRIGQQTTITQITLTAWAAILAYAIPKSSDLSHVNVLYDTIFLILVYPLLSYFISYSWAFNNTRICQIGTYLREREKTATKLWGLMNWENHIAKEPGIYKYNINDESKRTKLEHGMAIFIGTQVVSIFIACIILLLLYIFNEFPNWFPQLAELKPSEKEPKKVSLTLVYIFIIVDSIITHKTYKKIKHSGF